MDNKIFCLETEWEQSVYDLTHDTQAKPLLEFLKSSNIIDFIFRKVATKSDFDYYISHLKQASYKNYTIVYLCFHGLKGLISFADSRGNSDKGKYDLMDLAEDNPHLFDNKIVHFGSCKTLNMNEDKITEFKKLTGALMVTGYKSSVEMTGSFIFEAWLLNTLYKHPNFRAKRLLDLAHKEMPYFIDKYKFVAY